MDEIICFVINGIKLLLDIVLVSYNDVPLFFVCKNDNKDLYIALCEDPYNPEYIVIKPKMNSLKKMLNGNMTMRDLFIAQDQYYKIIPGVEIENDNVSLKPGNEIPLDVLPIEEAFFNPVTPELVEYVAKINSLYDPDGEGYSLIAVSGLPIDNCNKRMEQYVASADLGKQYTLELNDGFGKDFSTNFEPVDEECYAA